MTVGLGVLVGIIAFLVVEKLQRLLIGEGGHGHRNEVQFNRFFDFVFEYKSPNGESLDWPESKNV